MAVHAIVMSRHSSLFCEKWLSDIVNFYSEYSVLNICQWSHPRSVRQIIRDMIQPLTLIGNKYFASRKEAGRGTGNVIEVVKKEAYTKHKIPTVKSVPQHPSCKEITTRLGQIQSASLVTCKYPQNIKKCHWTSS